MANHCVDCDVCGTDLRGSGSDYCKWGGCPGGGSRADYQKIADEHPLWAWRCRAAEKLRELDAFAASAPEREKATAELEERQRLCGHLHEDGADAYRDIGGFYFANFRCELCGHEITDY